MQANRAMPNNSLVPAVPDMPAMPAAPETSESNLNERGNPINTAIDAEKLMHEAQIIGECFRVRVLFDTEQLKNDRDYISIIEDTWLRTFKNTAPELLAEAVQNFIVADKKGYLPKPGQIVEFLAKETKAIERRRYWAEIERLERKLLFEKYGDYD